MKRIFSSSLFGPAVATTVVTLLVMATTDRFLLPGNLNNLALQVSIVALVAIGSTLVIFIGTIDLSPGSAVALLTMLLAMLVKFWGVGFWPGIMITIIFGGGLGAINGMLTAYLRIPGFISTLAGYSAYRGIAFMFNLGSPVFDVSPLLDSLFYGTVFGIPWPLIYIVVFFAAAHWFMRYTRLGRSIYAVGGNAKAAHLSGINVPLTQFLAFVIAGLMTGVGAVLMAARLNSGSPNYGAGLELQAIAAAVIGGASLAGGRGDVLATLLGAMTITIVQNGLNLNAVPTSTQGLVIGLIIVLAVGIDMWRRELAGGVVRLWPGRTAKLPPTEKEKSHDLPSSV